MEGLQIWLSIRGSKIPGAKGKTHGETQGAGIPGEWPDALSFAGTTVGLSLVLSPFLLGLSCHLRP